MRQALERDNRTNWGMDKIIFYTLLFILISAITEMSGVRHLNYFKLIKTCLRRQNIWLISFLGVQSSD